MQFESFTALMAMNGHGGYVWSAYGVATVVLLTLVIGPLRQQRRFFAEQRQQLRRQQALSMSTANSPNNG